MRIVQLSDFHLSANNKDHLTNFYLESLLGDLKLIENEKKIDALIFTGDLVDKGGKSLGESPYTIFDDIVIKPIVESLNFNRNNIFFVPGNHDVNTENINVYTENGLKQIDKESANNTLKENKEDFNETNKRIKQYKDFEKQFHSQNRNYTYSNNESVAFIESNNIRIGFALINDSWRCSPELKKENHYIGYNQLFQAKAKLKEWETHLNLAIFHHPLSYFNSSEAEEIENILKAKDYSIAFFGHSHKHEYTTIISATGSYLSINGRTSFNSPTEKESIYQPGYNILDLDIQNRRYVLKTRKFIQDGFRFDIDTEALPNGEHGGMLPSNRYFELSNIKNETRITEDLPNSFSADVERIVSLLIGKSLYPEPYAFIRELIQNSVDACHRVVLLDTTRTPLISININTSENYVEVIDEGDGMSKYVVKNHFAVIGRSISQEFNDSTGNFNLISRFGIGFISTFIVADKVSIETKALDEEEICFHINNVFRNFTYYSNANKQRIPLSGTIVKVHLKKEFPVQNVLYEAHRYCRHISNLRINLNSNPVNINTSWNIENSIHTMEIENDTHQTKLAISQSNRNFTASNSGFFLANNSPEITPFRFPYIIGGEVNFMPKAIDFDMSRTKIMKSKKSESYRREISVSLRKLFRDVLEGNDPSLSQTVTNYLIYYLEYYDHLESQLNESYIDFYSKNELANLIAHNYHFNYSGLTYKLSEIISILKSRKIDKAFYLSQPRNDYQVIVREFLENQGYFIFQNITLTVAFRDATQQLGLVSSLQYILNTHSISLLDFNDVPADLTKDMKLDKRLFPETLQEVLKRIEQTYSIEIEIGKFSTFSKASVRNGNQIFLNHDHSAFSSLLNANTLPENVFETYLKGLLGLGLST